MIRDPVYGYVSVPAELSPIIDHRLFQRLRRISQTSLTSYVYPTATGSRFEHALGVMHLADRAWKAVWSHMEREDDSVRMTFISAAKGDIEALPIDDGTFGAHMGLAFRAAALLHDVGHTPFSHALEDAYRDHVWSPGEHEDSRVVAVKEGLRSFHEYCGRQIAARIFEDVFTDPDDPVVKGGVSEAALQILDGVAGTRGWSGALHGLLSGATDIDRIDYLIRDSYKAAGSEFGSIDYARLLDALEIRFDPEAEGVPPFRIAPGVRARSAVETLLIQRLQAYEYIHFHPRVVGFNRALSRAFELFLELSDIGEDEGGEDPIRMIFRRARPNLVYWDPEWVDVTGALGLWQPPAKRGEGTQVSIDDWIPDGYQLITAMKGGLPNREVAAAGVDDSAVIEMLKKADLLAGTAPQHYVKDPATKEQIERFRVYSKAALLRRKDFVPAWKSIDEYVDAADEMRGSLLEPAHARLLQLAAEGRGGPTVLTGVARRMQEALETPEPHERIGAVIALNTLMDLLLFRPALLKAIRAKLDRNRVVADQRGFWEVQYTGAGLVETLDVALYAKREIVSLSERSPLTEAVWFAEERRMKLAVFFFFAESDFSNPGVGNASSARGQVRRDVVKRLPEIVLSVVQEHV